MTVANQITILRILIIPIFIVAVLYYVHGGNEVMRYAALGLFGLASLSDAIDGFIARKYNQISELGTVLDPLADKLLLISGYIVLSLDNDPFLPSIPIWLTALIFSRDVLLVLGLILIHYTFGKIQVRPRIIGKAATVLQMLIILLVLAKLPLSLMTYLFFAAGICTGVSGVIYVWDGIRQLGTHPSSSPIQTEDED